jgi:hypothetical protein
MAFDEPERSFLSRYRYLVLGVLVVALVGL